MLPGMTGGVVQTWVGDRQRYRGLLLPLFSAPLVPAALAGILTNNGGLTLGCALGIGMSVLASRVVRRGRRGDARRAAVLMAVGTGLAAWFAAGLGHVLPFLMAAGAYAGTRMLYTAVPEAEPPPAPPPKPAVPGLVQESRARLARVQATAIRLADARLAGVAGAMQGVLEDLEARPDRLPVARRFLTVHLDGLERIAHRLDAGAAPPANLAPLLDDLGRTATELRERVRREESDALEIQVKVLSDRLRQEGFA